MGWIWNRTEIAPHSSVRSFVVQLVLPLASVVLNINRIYFYFVSIDRIDVDPSIEIFLSLFI